MRTSGPVHQCPDGFALFLGTMFALVIVMFRPGIYSQAQRHRHHRCPEAWQVIKRIHPSDEREPWGFGMPALMKNFVGRRYL